MRARFSDDRGATLVEAAFAIPIFFLMLLGLADFGTLAFEQNRATNAARDGTRVGIIDYIDAEDDGNDALDGDGSPQYEAIKAEIESKLAGRTLSDAELDVECLTPAGATVACADAVVDQDRMRVVVRWDREAVSPIAPALGFDVVEVSGDATMTIVGRPVGGPVTPAPPCSASGVTVSPSSVERDPGSNTLTQDLNLAVAGTGTCSNETLHVIAPGGGSTEICSSGCLGNTVYPGAMDAFWTQTGTGTVELRDGASTVLFSTTFTVTEPVPCDVTAVIPTDSAVARLSTNVLASDVGFTLIGADNCTGLTVTLTPPSGAPSRVLCSGVCTSTTYLSSGDAIWTTTGGARLQVTGDTATPFDDPAIFQVFDACSPTIQVDTDANTGGVQGGNATAKSNDKELDPPIAIALTPNAGADCSNLTVSVVAPNVGGSVFVACANGPCVGPTTFDGKTSSNNVWVPGTATVRVLDNLTNVTTSITFQVI